MKSLVSIVCTFVIAASTWGVSLTACFDGNSCTDVTVGYAANGSTAATRARVFALEINAGGGNILSIRGYSTTGGRGYSIYPGTIVVDANTGAIKNYGMPVEPNNFHGMGQSDLRSDRIIVVMCSLYEGSENAPAVSGKLFTITLDKKCSVTIAPETAYRCGVINEDGNTVPVDPVTLLEINDCSSSTHRENVTPRPSSQDASVSHLTPAQQAVVANWILTTTVADFNGDGICNPKDWAWACRDDFLARGIVWGRDEESFTKNLLIYIDEVYNREQHIVPNSRAHHDLARMRSDWTKAYVGTIWMAAIGTQEWNSPQ